jgi:hypothetical protein
MHFQHTRKSHGLSSREIPLPLALVKDRNRAPHYPPAEPANPTIPALPPSLAAPNPFPVPSRSPAPLPLAATVARVHRQFLPLPFLLSCDHGGGAPTRLLLSRSIPFTSGTHGPRRDITAGLPLLEVRIVQQEPCRFLHVDVPLPPPRHLRIPAAPRSTHLASPSPSLHSMWNRRRGCHSGHMTTRRHRSYHLRTSAVARMSQLAGASATVAVMESREGER